MSCAISGCNNAADHNLSIRLRRPDTSAIWAPNTKAFLCDQHAEQGVKITIILEPTNAGKVETEVLSATTKIRRITKIKNKP